MEQILKHEHSLEVFFDGDCPLCRREIEMVRGRDHQGQILFTDISLDSFKSFSPAINKKRLMDEIHARDQEGRVMTGVEVFRQIYSRIGFNRLVRLSRVWGMRGLLDVVYRLWAKNRLRLTGRRCDSTCAV